MKSLIFYNNDPDEPVHVEFKTDLITEDAEVFSVLEIKGLDDFEIKKGIQFKLLDYNLGSFKQFALDNHLGLLKVDSNEIIELVSSVMTPNPPTNGIVDDELDTFAFTLAII